MKNGPTQILPKQILVKDKMLDLFGSKWISFVIWGGGGSFLDLFADAFLKAGLSSSAARSSQHSLFELWAVYVIIFIGS